MARYEQLENRTFVNPYNFISLESRCSKGLDYKKIKEQDNLLTGWLKCTLKTLTPIFIPNTTSVVEDKGDKFSDVFQMRTKDKAGKEIKINSYDFYSYEDLSGKTNPQPSKPVIPGSEIRGMIRSAFEAVTNSCLSTVDDDQLLYKRVTKPGTPGRLVYRNGKWLIIECERIGISFRSTPGDKRDFRSKIKALNIKEKQKIYIKIDGKYITGRGHEAYRLVDEIELTQKPGYVEGYFHKGEPFGNRKHHESVFVECQGGVTIYILEETLKNYRKNVEIYLNKSINIHKRKGEHSGYDHVDLENFNGALIYYTEHNGKYYLCPAAIGREVFYNKLTEVIGSYEPCSRINNLCPACALFGIAGKDEAVASRVRFTDGKLQEEINTTDCSSYFEEVKILPELASPKLSATEFYLKKFGNADLWNYDYAIRWQRDGNTIRSNIDRYPPEELRSYRPAIRGRKFYWHQGINSVTQIPDPPEPSDRNVAVRALKKEKEFTFYVYFNDIAERELKQLIWILEVGGKPENAHKIGMGKPIGLGSVKISVDDVKIRRIALDNDSINYSVNPDGDILRSARQDTASINLLGGGQVVLEEFLEMTKFVGAPSGVSYPANEGSAESYKWFGANKQSKGRGVCFVIDQPLPGIRNPRLKKYREM